jgi:uroporphyrinogen-III synthase
MYSQKEETHMAQGPSWKVIHMARSEKHAQIILSALETEGFLVRLKQVYRTVSSDENYYEIMVPGGEATEAQQLLIEKNLLL